MDALKVEPTKPFRSAIPATAQNLKRAKPNTSRTWKGGPKLAAEKELCYVFVMFCCFCENPAELKAELVAPPCSTVWQSHDHLHLFPVLKESTIQLDDPNVILMYLDDVVGFLFCHAAIPDISMLTQTLLHIFLNLCTVRLFLDFSLYDPPVKVFVKLIHYDKAKKCIFSINLWQTSEHIW